MRAHLLRSVYEHVHIVGSPLNKCAIRRSKFRYLALIKLKLAEHNSLTLEAVAAIGPGEQVRVVEAAVLEVSAVDWRLRPDLVVGVVGSLLLFLLVIDLLPLEHLDFALETIAVLSDDAEIAITQVDLVRGRA